MEDIITAIKKDSTFDQSQADFLYQQALNRFDDHITVSGVFPMMLQEINEHLSSGYHISPMNPHNQMRAGFVQIALRKPESLITQEKMALKLEVEEQYREGLERTKQRLIEQAVEDVLSAEREAEIEALRVKEVARQESVRAGLIKGLK